MRPSDFKALLFVWLIWLVNDNEEKVIPKSVVVSHLSNGVSFME